MPNASRRFRDLHERDELFAMPNPWDAGTAKMLEGLGFEAIATASAALAIVLGRADAEWEVERDEALEHARTLIHAVDVPVNGDLESGFGHEPEEVATTIREAIRAGLAGCSIEDRTGVPSRPLYERDHAVERIRAACAARDETDPDFVLTARCEAYLVGHVEPLRECLDRLTAMEEAGADVAYACGMSREEDIAALVKAVRTPVNVLGGSGASPLSLSALQDLGVRRVSLGPRLVQAAMGAFLRAAREVREEGTFGFMAEAGNLKEIYAMFRAGNS